MNKYPNRNHFFYHLTVLMKYLCWLKFWRRSTKISGKGSPLVTTSYAHRTLVMSTTCFIKGGCVMCWLRLSMRWIFGFIFIEKGWVLGSGFIFVVVDCYGCGLIETDNGYEWPCPCGSLMEEGCPFEGSLFTWRLFRNRLPSKPNLLHRSIILPKAQLCFSDCGLQETKNHLFWSWYFFGQIWQLVGNCFVFIQRNHLIFWIIFISLVPLQVLINQDAHSCIWSSLLALGWYGNQWMIEYSVVNNVFLRNFWRMLSFFPFCGLKLMLLSFIIAFITGAKTLSYVRVLANFVSCCWSFRVIFGRLLWYTLYREDNPLLYVSFWFLYNSVFWIE